MRTGLRVRLFAASFALVVLVGVPVSIFLEGKLRDWTRDQVVDELSAYARSVQVDLRNSPQDATQALVASHGDALDARVTVISSDGTVIGDSGVPDDRLKTLENHSDRAEIVDAREQGVGVAQRISSTVGAELLYVAIRDGERFVRVATTLDRIDDAVTRLRVILGLSALVFLAAGVFLSGLASSLATARLRPLVSTAGSFTRVTAELERTVALLGRERDRFQTALERLDEGVIAINRERRITLINPAAMRLLGLASSPVGRPLVEAARAPEFAELARLGEDDACEREFELDGPPRRRVLTRACPLRSGAGVVFSVHDMTELRLLETMRRDFVANVSHELRTPVSIVMANAETLLSGAIDDKERGPVFLNAIHRQAERLSRLINDLLDLSRIEAGQFQMDAEHVMLGPVVGRTLESLEARAADTGHTLSSGVIGTAAVLADRQAVEHVLMNLVDNAIKYTPDGSHVEVSAHTTDGVTRVSVADNGPGIAERHRPRIFERFYRVDKGRARNMGGTGLGLAIVKHMVDSMGGRVGVDPNHPRGSIFWLELPASTSPPRD